MYAQKVGKDIGLENDYQSIVDFILSLHLLSSAKSLAIPNLTRPAFIIWLSFDSERIVFLTGRQTSGTQSVIGHVPRKRHKIWLTAGI